MEPQEFKFVFDGTKFMRNGSNNVVVPEGTYTAIITAITGMNVYATINDYHPDMWRTIGNLRGQTVKTLVAIIGVEPGTRIGINCATTDAAETGTTLTVALIPLTT